jgi:sugar phosphate isomerase/epimerase
MRYRIGRREFVASVGLGAAGLAQSAGVGAAATAAGRRFFFILSVGRMGFKASFPEAVNLAARHGFEGLDPDAGYFAGLSDDELKRVLADLKAKNLRLGAAGLPVEFRKDDATFNDGLKKLSAAAATLQKAGVTRVSTWIVPCDDQLTYLQNFRQHAYRLRACAQILKDHGQRLGLEYVGTRTLWRSKRHPFAHTLSEIKELIVVIGTGNVGVQLDSWHWFNAEETAEDILTLRNEDVVTVDLNDAPAGLTLDQQLDNQRELPGATGVIPVGSFLEGLKQIGYDGPTHAEPFNAALRAKPIDEACALTAAAMKKVLAA